jgi:hypothetical protein
METTLRTPIVALAVALVLAGTGARAAEDEIPVDLELVLAVDVSASMTRDEQELQRQGYVEAFRSRRVLNAIRSGAHGRIAVAYVEWADEGNQQLVLPWTLVDSADSASRFAEALAAAPIGREFGTSISGAVRFARGQFESNGYAGERQAIDVSGDGPNNLGPPVDGARDAAVADGVTINGLPIMIRLRWGAGLYSIEGLDYYFEDCVIGGPGAFVVVVKSDREFASAIERKLVLEISGGPTATVMPVAAFRRPQRMDCMSGERNGGRLLPAQ